MKTLAQTAAACLLTLCIAGLARSQQPLTQSANLAPFPVSARTATNTFTLEPQQTGNYNVTIQSGAPTYSVQVSSPVMNPAADPDNLWIWRQTGGGLNSFTFQVVNTIWEERSVTVTVNCVWVPVSAVGGGSGGCIAPETIQGEAKGIANHLEGHLKVKDLAILDPPDYLCINETLELSAWVVRPEDPIWLFWDAVDAQWEVTPTSSGTFDPSFGQSVLFTPLETGVVTITATVPGTVGPITESISITVIKVDSVKFQKSTMGTNWKTVDQPYQHLGVFTSQSATFGVNHEPASVAIPTGFLTWGGLASGNTPEVSVTFSTENFLQAVNVTCGGSTRAALVAIRDQPSGIGRTAYAALHPVYTAIAYANDLIGTDPTTLEPIIWANSAYPGVQHNTVADAARHAYWTCLLARYTVAGYAEGLTTQHEVSSPGPSTETVMDLHNNLMGISIEGDHTHTSGLGCCRTSVQSAVSAGTLWYLDSSYGAVNTAEDALLQPTDKP